MLPFVRSHPARGDEPRRCGGLVGAEQDGGEEAVVGGDGGVEVSAAGLVGEELEDVRWSRWRR